MFRILLPFLISLSLYAQNITLADLAFLVSKKDNVNIIFSSEVSKTLIVDYPTNYKGVQYLPVFKSVLAANNLTLSNENGFYTVLPKLTDQATENLNTFQPLKPPPPISSYNDNKTIFVPNSLDMPDTMDKPDFNITLVSYNLKYLQFDSIKPLLDFSGVQYAFSPISKTITLKSNKHNKTFVPNLVNEIEAMDVLKVQQTIKITIYDINMNKLREVGINPSLNFDFSLLSQSSSILSGTASAAFSGSLKFLSNKGVTNVHTSTNYLISDGDHFTFNKTLSVPFLDENFVLTTDNGTNQSKKYKYRDVGFKIDLIPAIVGDTCYLDFDLQIGNIVKDSELPTTSQTIIKNRFSLRSGEIVLLAGISKKSTERTNETLPFIDSIPIISDIFDHKKDLNNDEYFNIAIELQ